MLTFIFLSVLSLVFIEVVKKRYDIQAFFSTTTYTAIP